MLNETIIISAPDASRPNNSLTVGTVDERRSGWQMLFSNCTFNIESIPVCDGGTPIHVTKVTLDHIEVQVAVHQDDSSGVPNTKQSESSWHRVSVTTCQL